MRMVLRGKRLDPVEPADYLGGAYPARFNGARPTQKFSSLQFYIVSFLKRRFVARKLLAFFREYSATIVVVACVIITALLNISSNKSTSGSFFDALGMNSTDGNGTKNKTSLLNQQKNNLATVPLADPGYLTADSYAAAEDFTDDDSLYYAAPTMQSQILLAAYNPSVSGGNGREAKTYTVKDGDTVSSIAARHGISSNTVLWANNLSDTSMIKPGDKLSVLPVSGIKYKVQKGDSLDTIVTKFNSDKQKVLAYNELPADEKLREGQELVLPDGYISSPTAAPSATGTRLATAGQTSAVSTAVAYSPIRMSGGGSGHRFPYGYCTWYVAQRRYVPWGGNAGAWLANARASGKATGRTPRPGAIMVSGESRWGHVALVESVSGSSFTVSEMNYSGFGRKSRRTISTNSRVVKGFIY